VTFLPSLLLSLSLLLTDSKVPHSYVSENGEVAVQEPEVGGVAAKPAPKYDVVRINLDDEISETTALQTIDSIEEANNTNEAKSIVLVIDSPGGSIPAGWAIVKAMEKSKAPITCVVDGTAASMAFVVLEGCDIRLMTPRSQLMMHEAAVIVQEFRGQPTVWSNIASALKTITRAMVEHCAAHMKISPDELEAKIIHGQEWWMNWKEAVAVGAVDDTLSSVKGLFQAFDNMGLTHN